MMRSSTIYWERHWRDKRPATEAQWVYLVGRQDHDYLYSQSYDNMVRGFSEYWRRRYDEAEGGDFADWLEHGPFNAMRYYHPAENPRPRNIDIPIDN